MARASWEWEIVVLLPNGRFVTDTGIARDLPANAPDRVVGEHIYAHVFRPGHPELADYWGDDRWGIRLRPSST